MNAISCGYNSLRDSNAPALTSHGSPSRKGTNHGRANNAAIMLSLAAFVQKNDRTARRKDISAADRLEVIEGAWQMKMAARLHSIVRADGDG